jgi:hypothetical protein
LEQSKLMALIVGITVASGLFDAQGFIHAAKIWQDGVVVWSEVGKSALYWGAGICLYCVSLKFMIELQIVSPEIQTVAWFGVTIVGVGLASGRFFSWEPVDQAVAMGVLAGLGWLLFRVGE